MPAKKSRHSRLRKELGLDNNPFEGFFKTVEVMTKSQLFGALGLCIQRFQNFKKLANLEARVAGKPIYFVEMKNRHSSLRTIQISTIPQLADLPLQEIVILLASEGQMVSLTIGPFRNGSFFGRVAHFRRVTTCHNWVSGISEYRRITQAEFNTKPMTQTQKASMESKGLTLSTYLENPWLREFQVQYGLKTVVEYKLNGDQKYEQVSKMTTLAQNEDYLKISVKSSHPEYNSDLRFEDPTMEVRTYWGFKTRFKDQVESRLSYDIEVEGLVIPRPRNERSAAFKEFVKWKNY